MNNMIIRKRWNQRLSAWLFGSCRRVGLIFCLAVNGMCMAADHSGHGSMQPHDMARIWQTALARQPLAVTATFDASGKLWQASVKDGHVYGESF